jgi:hypothetical protein
VGIKISNSQYDQWEKREKKYRDHKKSKSFLSQAGLKSARH